MAIKTIRKNISAQDFLNLVTKTRKTAQNRVLRIALSRQKFNVDNIAFDGDGVYELKAKVQGRSVELKAWGTHILGYRVDGETWAPSVPDELTPWQFKATLLRPFWV